MNLEKFELLKQRADKDIKVDLSNIVEKSLKFSSIYHNYSKLYIDELKQLKELSLEKEKIFGELYDKYKFHNDYKLDSKTEIEIYVKSDKQYFEIAQKYYQQESIVKYLEQLIDNINKVGYNIKNYIELEKIKLGI